MSILSVHDLQGISAYNNKIRVPSGHQLDVDGALKLPTWTDSTRPAAPEVGLVGYNTESGRTELYDGEDWVLISAQAGGTGESADKAAESADAILAANPSATSGPYWINVNGTAKQIYCLMNPPNANGGWHLVMAIRRQDSLLLNVSGAVNTVPATNPFIVGNQAKLSDSDITLLGPQSTGYYNVLMEQYTWRSNPTSPPGYSTTTPWPLDGTTVCTYASVQGLMPTGNISGDFQRSSFWFKSTVPLRGSGTKITGSTVTGMTTVNRYNPAGTADAFSMSSVNNTPGQHQYDSTTYIYDLCVAAGTGSSTCAYATTCGDSKSGPYGHESTYNCYHRYNLIYVR
jgi:hypothetical protein